MRKYLNKEYCGLASIFLIFAILSLACATSSEITVPTSYSEVVEISGTKEALYTKANLAFVDLFNKADSVIQFSDKEAGIIKGKYTSSFSKGLGSFKAWSTVEVSVKDNKYRITMNLADIVSSFGGKDYPVDPGNELFTEMNKEWKQLADSFKAKMYTDSSW